MDLWFLHSSHSKGAHVFGVPGDPEKSDPSQSVRERKVRGRLKCFKRCSVPKRLSCVVSVFCNSFRRRTYPE